MRDMNEKVFKPRSDCIYCFTSYSPEIHSNGFSREHIIPESIGGRYIAPRAVCPSCRELTSDTYEKRTIKNLFRIPRILLGIKRKNQKKKEKASNYLTLPPVAIGPFSKLGKGLSYEVDLELLSFPLMFCLPKYLPAGFLCLPLNDGYPKCIQLITIAIGDVGKLPTDGITVQTVFNFFDLGMTLAKMAYSFAVCEGLETIVNISDIQDLILGKRTDVYNFVGSFRDAEVIANELHQISFSFIKDMGIVRLHLFSCCTTQSYMVVIGKKIKINPTKKYAAKLPDATHTHYTSENDDVAFHMNIQQPKEVTEIRRYARELISDPMPLKKPPESN